MKRKILVFLMAVILTVGIAGCDEKPGNPTVQNQPEKGAENKNKVKIIYSQFSAGDSNADTLQQMADDFMAENQDVEVEIQSKGYDEYFTALATKMAGSGAPDCFELNLENFLSYAIRDNLEPLEDYFARLGADKTVYAAGPLKAAEYNQKIYGIPQTFSTVVLIYNKNLFDQAGVEYPDSSWTWKEENEAAQKIRALGEDIWGVYQPVSYHELYKAVKQNGGSLLSEDGKQFTMAQEANRETLDMMLARVSGPDRVMPNAEDLAGRGDWDLFKEGKLGMIHTGIWAFQDFKENISEFEWDIAVEPGNTMKATHLFSNMAAINKAATQDKKDAAFRFLNYMAVNPKAVELRLQKQWELPVISEESTMQMYLSQTPPSNKKAVLDSMQYAVAPPALIEYAAVAEMIKNRLDNAVLNGDKAADVLKQIQEELVNKNLMNP